MAAISIQKVCGHDGCPHVLIGLGYRGRVGCVDEWGRSVGKVQGYATEQSAYVGPILMNQLFLGWSLDFGCKGTRSPGIYQR